MCDGIILSDKVRLAEASLSEWGRIRAFITDICADWNIKHEYLNQG